MTGLPDTWSLATLAEVSDQPQYGYTTSAAPKGQTKFLRTTDITSGSIDWSAVPYCKDEPDDVEKYRLHHGDIVISRAGSVGVSQLVNNPQDAVFASYLIRFRPLIEPNFFAMFLKSGNYWTQISEHKAGIAVPNVNAKKLAVVTIPIPPLNEQRRILEKIEALFDEINKGVESLQTARTTLALYRQSLLKSAFEGRLTAGWRVQNAGKMETPEALRARIQSKREARLEDAIDEWQEAVEKWRADGKKGKRPTKPKRPKEPVGIEVENLPELPEAWMWVSLDEIVSGRPRSLQSGPFGSSLKHSEFQEEGVLVVGIDNVHNGTFSMGNENRISEEKYQELEKYTARPRDLLITVMASLGRSCVIPESLETSIITKHVYRITIEHELLCVGFYNYLIQAEWVTRKSMLENAVGQTRPGINSTILRSLPVQILDKFEQAEICRRLDARLEAADELEAELEAALIRADALRQSILKKAFSGQLIPQDPSDQPASELLERIKVEKAEREQTAKRERKSASSRKPKERRPTLTDLIKVLEKHKDWISASRAAQKLGIADGSSSDDVEAFYRQLKDYVEASAIEVERRGEEDWLRLAKGEAS